MILAAVVSNQIYQNRPLTTDENSYLFQAQNFLEGQIARPLPEIPEAFFHMMIIMDPERGWFSRYPPAHPLWLAPGVLVGYPYLMSFLGAALGIILLGRIAKHLGMSACFAACLLVVSPFYHFMYGSILSHTSGFVFSAAMLLFYVRWHLQHKTTDAALAGLFWGLLLLNRTYTALLMAVPFGLDASITFLARRNLATFKGCCSFAGISALFIGLYRLYNKAATGSSRLPTFLMYDDTEGLGFGLRHSRGLVVEHTFTKGLHNLWENLLLMDQWMWGFTGGLILVLALALIGWRKRWSPLLLATPAVIWSGYIYFWYPGIEHFRPVYFFESILFLMLAASFGFHKLHLWMKPYPKLQRAATILVPVILILLGTPFVRAKALFFFEHNREARIVYDQIHAAPPNSLVLLEGFERKVLGENMLNPNGLASDPLVARNNPYSNDALTSLFPSHNVFILSPHTQGLQPYNRKANASYLIPATQAYFQTGADETDLLTNERVRCALPNHGPGFLLFGRYPYLAPGKWLVKMPYTIQDVEQERPVRLELAAKRGREIIQQTSLYGTASNAVAEILITIDTTQKIEPRVYFNGSGSIWIPSIFIEQIEP